MSEILALLCTIILMFSPCHTDNADVKIKNESLDFQTEEVVFTLTNTTNRCIMNECNVSSFEKKTDGIWVTQPYEYLVKEIAFVVFPGQQHTSKFKVADLSGGEYRFCVEYTVKESLTKTVTGKSLVYFTLD